MLKLPNVTLVAVTSKNREAHQRAINYSSKFIKFGASKILDLNTNNIDEWNHAVIYKLGQHIDTEFALLIHADGFVVNPYAWKDEWLNYDYIGSPWPLPQDGFSYRDTLGRIVRVGNSVGLRSKRILDLPSKLNLEWKPYYGNTNEDGFLACHQRVIFEEMGIKYAPFEIALEFGREVPLPENYGTQPFVFHRYEGENANYPRFI